MILVEIYVPALDAKYDFQLDENRSVRKISGELCEILSKKTKSQITLDANQFMLCSMNNKEVLVPEKTLYQNKISNGSKLIFV